jgi:predicted nucleotidyltransferase
MSEESPKVALVRLVRIFNAHGVEFMIIGGQAEGIFGSPRVTYDVDFCYRRTKENLQRLASALRELNPRLRGAPPDLDYIIDARSLALGNNFTFTTDIIDLDLLGFVEPIGAFEDLLRHAEKHQIEGMDVLTISLDDLIKVKSFIRRPKDTDSLMQLAAIKQARARQGGS